MPSLEVAFTNADMFGFSLPKLLFTIIAVLAIWHGFKLFARYQEDRRANRGKVHKRGGTAASDATSNARATADEFDSEEMIKCPVCETYVSANAAVSCGRNGCPYPG